MSSDPQILAPKTETIELSDGGRKYRDSGTRRNDEDDDDKVVVKFRCDLPSTPGEVMLTRGWMQVI